jgi:NAD(P)H-dependent FMN reductase
LEDREWNNKAVGFVGYGGNGGARSVEILRQVVSNVELADVRAQVGLSLFTDFESFTTCSTRPVIFPPIWAVAVATLPVHGGG